jgi:hypothetical protein
MIQMELKRLLSFKQLARNHRTVYFKRNHQGFTYYVISEQSGVGVVNVFRSKQPIKFSESLNLKEPEEIRIDFLVEVDNISILDGNPFLSE